MDLIEVAESVLEKHWSRQYAINLLREKHRLDFFSVTKDMNSPREIQERQKAYERDLRSLLEKWAKEDSGAVS